MASRMAQPLQRLRQTVLAHYLSLIDSLLRRASIGLLLLTSLVSGLPFEETKRELALTRVGLFPCHLNKAEGPTSAEFLTLSADGRCAIYADSLGHGIGFVDLSDPSQPKPGGWISLPGEPTSVALLGNRVLVTSDLGSHRGALHIVSLGERRLEKTVDLPGQPDSLAVSPDSQYVVIAIENEALDGFPDSKPGELLVLQSRDWRIARVALTGLAEIYPDDPEPEFVAVSKDNLAALTLQENNHIVLVDLASAKVVHHFSAGRQTLVDGTVVPREPDGIAWCSMGVVSADEGDWQGGGRSFTIFSLQGEELYNSGDLTESLARRMGQYPLARTGARGSEPESVFVATYRDRELLFVVCERSNLVHLFELTEGEVRFVQSLPTAVGPESIAFDAVRGLVVVGAEVDLPEDDLRAQISIYGFSGQPDPYHIVSAGEDWSALSGLTYVGDSRLVAVGDKSVSPNRLFRIDLSTGRPILAESLPLLTSDGTPLREDLEGVSAARQGGFWLVREGGKKTPPGLLLVGSDGVLQREIRLPSTIVERTPKHGLEGVSEIDGVVYVAFQSAWKGDQTGLGHIGRYSPRDGSWQFFDYPLERGHFITGLSNGPENTLAVLERDKFGGEKARHKAVFLVDLKQFGGSPHRSLGKRLAVDLIEEYRSRGLPVAEKIEGLAFDGSKFWVVNDNDSLKEGTGETLLLQVDPAGSRRPTGKDPDGWPSRDKNL